MDWNEATLLARTLMNEHGLGHVPLEQSNAKRQAGATTFAVRKVNGLVVSTTVKNIELSRSIVELNDKALVEDTIRHEIAHALAGFEAGHSYEWKRVAQQVGANPERCCADGTKMPEGLYQADCCGIVRHMHRRPKVIRICRVCRNILNWKKTR